MRTPICIFVRICTPRRLRGTTGNLRGFSVPKQRRREIPAQSVPAAGFFFFLKKPNNWTNLLLCVVRWKPSYWKRLQLRLRLLLRCGAFNSFLFPGQWIHTFRLIVMNGHAEAHCPTFFSNKFLDFSSTWRGWPLSLHMCHELHCTSDETLTPASLHKSFAPRYKTRSWSGCDSTRRNAPALLFASLCIIQIRFKVGAILRNVDFSGGKKSE